MFHERTKVPVVVQEIIVALDAARGDHRVNRLANGHAQPAQGPKVPRRLNSDSPPSQIYDRQGCQKLPGLVEVSFVSKAL